MESVLDFGRGCQDLAIILLWECGEGGGGRKWSAGKLPLLSHMDGGGGDRVWPRKRLHSTRMQFSFSFLFLPSSFCCRGLFQYKKACGKPYMIKANIDFISGVFYFFFKFLVIKTLSPYWQKNAGSGSVSRSSFKQMRIRNTDIIKHIFLHEAAMG